MSSRALTYRFLVFLFTSCFMTTSYGNESEDIGVTEINGQFATSEGLIPAGCFAQLRTELNGDNTIASVFITRARLRGCMDANDTYPGSDQNAVSYSIEKRLHHNLFGLRVCKVTGGSMGSSCDNILIDFSNKAYITKKGVRSVLTVNKVGDW